jgi:hypothetical protein
MNCHNCEHAAEIADGKFAGIAWEETPCSRCEGKENSAFTIEFRTELERPDLSGVRRQGLKQGEGPMDGEGQPEVVQGDGGEPGELRLPISVMREALATLLMLEPETRDVVCWRFSGMKYPEIALVQNVTTAAVEARHKRAIKQHPILRALFPVKVAKQAVRRKPHEHRPAA